MAQDAARPDDKVIDARGNGRDIGRAQENAERVVILRHAPGAFAHLDEMHLAAPAAHDAVFIDAAILCETQPLPELCRGVQVIVGNDGERAGGGWRHGYASFSYSPWPG